MAKEPTETTQITSNIPNWAKPYATRLLGEAEKLTGEGYQPYEGQRLAGFSPLQMQAFQDIAGMQTADQLRQATGLAGIAGLRAGELSRYSPAYAQQFYQSPEYGRMGLDYLRTQAAPSSQYQMGAPERVSAQGYGPLSMAEPSRVSAPFLQQYQMGAPERVGAERVSAGDLRAAQSGYRPSLQAYQMGPAERVGADKFGAEAMREYMSPYMEGVVERQKSGAVQDYLRQLPGIGAASVRAGARGGTREALLESEARRGLSERLGDIEAQGLQQAYQQASSQFGQDRAARMQAELANQQAGLTVGQQNLASRLGVQQLGTQAELQTAMANLSNEQQARVQQEANRLQAQGMNQQSALQSALANQQAGLTTGQQNLAAQLGVQQLGSGQSLQAQLANQQMGFNVGQQNLAAEQARQQFMGQQGLQAALANQQAGLTSGQTNLQALINQAQFGAGQNLQAQQLNQAAALQAQQQGISQQQALNQLLSQDAAQRAQYGLAGAQFGEQSRQFGANLGLQGLQQQLAAAGALGGLGMQQYQQQMGISASQLGAGGQMQALEQELLNQQYQDFLNQQRLPYQQIEFMSNVLRGTPSSGATQTLYQQPGSLFGQIAGIGLGLGSLFGGLGGSSGTPTTGGGILSSDRRLKSNIVRVGTHPLGIGVYEYDIWGLRQRGVMADEVLTVMPEAVVTQENGYMAVRYDMIGGV